MTVHPQKIDHIAKAQASWPTAPDWVLALATACNASSQALAGRRIDYAASTISQVISNTYRGDLGRVEEMVRGAFMSATVDCPQLGEIGSNKCLDWQKKPYAPTSSHRVEMYNACRVCPLATRQRREDAA